MNSKSVFLIVYLRYTLVNTIHKEGFMFGFEVYRPQIFLALTFIWIAEIVVFRPKVSSEHIDSSFSGILRSILFSIGLTSIFNFFGYFSIKSDQMLISKAGLVLYAAGLFIRLWSRIELGKYFSHHITVEADQPLISSGPYRIFRHPLYIGLFILTQAVSIYLYNYAGFIISAGLMIASLGKRVKKEEEDMEKIMGQRYIKWKKKRI